jgi:hypothetical protein
MYSVWVPPRTSAVFIPKIITEPTAISPSKRYILKTLKGSQTEKNLMRTIARESQDRKRYSFFASKAKKEGFVHIPVTCPACAHSQAHFEILVEEN